MKTNHLLFTVALFFSIAFMNAQDKYEFMIIEYSTIKFDLGISIDGKEYKKEKADFSSQEKTGYNANPLLIKVKEYQDKGWEVMSFNSAINGGTTAEVHFAHLRKKIK
ncbi:MAG: hypothetical protein Q8L81_06660 [Bacteroidota bacterium]|nr:hypothetical protein [Bacteroidota bacterium]